MGLFDFFRKKKLGAGSDVEQSESVAKHATASKPKAKLPTLTKFDDVPTLTADTLRAVEKKYGFQLPHDYRKFLLEHNGGFPLPECVTFTEASGGDRTVKVGHTKTAGGADALGSRPARRECGLQPGRPATGECGL